MHYGIDLIAPNETPPTNHARQLRVYSVVYSATYPTTSAVYPTQYDQKKLRSRR